jgi:hypothetical protein
MKTFLALTVLLASVSSHAWSLRTQKFSESFVATTEAELIAEVESALPSIQNADYKRVAREMRNKGCYPLNAKHIEIGSLSISKYYKYEGGSLVPYVRGSLYFSHDNCRIER